MNKIELIDGKIKEDIDENISINIVTKNELFDIKKITIEVLNDTTLELIINSEKLKIDIEFMIHKNVKFNLIKRVDVKALKMQTKYNILENSLVDIIKYYDSNEVKELDTVNLNGKKAKINYELVTIANSMQKYDLVIYHNAKETESYIKNKGVNIKGGINFNVIGSVLNNIEDCIIDQKNRIINLNTDICTIKPELLIEENNVVANHSALIGKFNEDELFYLMSRGISENEATILLIKGFLISDKDDKIFSQKIEKYWR